VYYIWLKVDPVSWLFFTFWCSELAGLGWPFALFDPFRVFCLSISFVLVVGGFLVHWSDCNWLCGSLCYFLLQVSLGVYRVRSRRARNEKERVRARAQRGEKGAVGGRGRPTAHADSIQTEYLHTHDGDERVSQGHAVAPERRSIVGSWKFLTDPLGRPLTRRDKKWPRRGQIRRWPFPARRALPAWSDLGQSTFFWFEPFYLRTNFFSNCIFSEFIKFRVFLYRETGARKPRGWLKMSSGLKLNWRCWALRP
jgi:hypothetical protein